jgi:hypothetical protein
VYPYSAKRCMSSGVKKIILDNPYTEEVIAEVPFIGKTE